MVRRWLLTVYAGVMICCISVNHLTDLKQSATFVPKGQPVAGNISSPFGPRRHPVSKRPDFHKGIDIQAAARTLVRTTAGGKVKWAGHLAGYGRCVMVDHGHGWETLYAHLANSFLKAGMPVSAGQAIGKVGKSGMATGPHLHYEVMYRGRVLDPAYFTAGSDPPAFSRLESSFRAAFSPLN